MYNNDEVEMADKMKRGVCYHSDAVECESHNCGKCGWNPVVDAARKKQTRGRMAFEARLQSAMKRGVNRK